MNELVSRVNLTSMDKLRKFEKELNYINNAKIRDVASLFVSELPEHFFYAPASTTGRYHPKYASGEGGLLRHTQACVGIAVELFNNHTIQNFAPWERDIIVLALILHDGRKHLNGQDKYNPYHPVDMAEYVRNRFIGDDFKMIRNLLADCIETHMGEWCLNKDDSLILPTPKTEMQKFVHLCDYLASRRCLEFNFD